MPFFTPSGPKQPNKFFVWLKETVDTLCNRPDHLQRLSIIGSGMALYPLVVWLIWIMWKGFGSNPDLLLKQIDWLGWMAIGILSLFALVLITLLGTIKGIHITGPGGVEVDLQTTAEAKDNDPPAPTIVTTTTSTSIPAPPAPPTPPAKKSEGDVS